MTTDRKDGTMVSRSVQKVPTDPQELQRYLTRVLTSHFQDIEQLYSMTTDCDAFEKKQRDNAT